MKEKKIAIGMISIKNKPDRQTDNSVAFEVSARLEYYDREDRKIAHVKCGHWTKESAEKYFSEMGKKKNCEKITFYTHDTWNLPIAYQVEGSDTVYAYDHSNVVNSKKIGKLPLTVSIVFEGENLKSARAIKYLLIPNTTATQPTGFWMQKR